ncbi:MAG: hypothetical protein J6F30_17075 [Cellulosilyticum sp.]|nr:hypothetical protein [Cellulosilyticum sp.]
MSAFLGPIHYWLYGKIKLQEDLVDQVVSLAKEEGLADMGATLISKYGQFDRSPLETIIDGSNIHGWLQDKVSKAEYKLAEGVTILLNQDASLLDQLEMIFYAAGEERASGLLQEEGLTLSRIYKAISDSLLDGMPCDRAVAIVREEEDEIVWKMMQCVHERYWNEVNGDISHYYKLREAYLNGFAKALGLKFEVVDTRMYSIKK